MGQTLAHDVQQPDADAVHRGEHELLGQGDPDVDPADARAHLVVGLVVRAEHHRVEPADERLLEALDLSLPAGDGGARARVRFDGVVEVVDDRAEERLGDGVEVPQRRGRFVREADVLLEALEEGQAHGGRPGQRKTHAPAGQRGSSVLNLARDRSGAKRSPEAARAWATRKECANPRAAVPVCSPGLAVAFGAGWENER